MQKICLTLAFIILIASISKGQTGLSKMLNARDSLLFEEALHGCNMQIIEEIFTPDFVYYQDKGDGSAATSTPRDEFIENIKGRCAAMAGSFPVHRELVQGSVTVSAIGSDEATQTGIQRFFLRQEGQPEQMVEESHFTRIWGRENGSWKMRCELDFQIKNPSSQDAARQDDSLFRQVTGADSALFAAYDDKNLEGMKKFFASDIEFYHDKGGLSHYQDLCDNFQKHFGTTGYYSRRQVDPASLQVYPLNHYGAVETGVHRFYGMQDGHEVLEATANFINVWHFKDGSWRLIRVVSYDHH